MTEQPPLQDSESGVAVHASFALWQHRDPVAGLGSVAAYRELADRLLKQGAPLLANEVLADGLERWRGDVRLRQLHGLAFARSGLIEEANGLLTQLQQEGAADEESLGLLARTHKDLAIRATDAAARERELRSAHRIYRDAYERYGGTWTGINGATTAVLLGDEESARMLAEEIYARAVSAISGEKTESEETYWTAATAGEAALILLRWDDAESWYARARREADNRFGDLSSTRRNARLILEARGQPLDWLERALPMPSVVVFVGHMIDLPDRTVPRFPPELEAHVRSAIEACLRRVDGRIGYASAARGADILFQEAMQDLGGETHVVLPFDESSFVPESVEGIPGSQWIERFHTVLARADETLIISPSVMDDPIAFDYANSVLHGLGVLRAGELETGLVPLAVWDGKQGDGPGGTGSMVARWRELGYKVEIIDLPPPTQGQAPARRTHPAGTPTARPSSRTQVVAIIFGDVVKFSELAERQIVPFVEHFLGGVAKLLQSGAHYTPSGRNTWGDGLFFVFESTRDAGLFALDLRDFVLGTDWERAGLRKGLNLRIGVHAGPVYPSHDPLTGQATHFGTHISRAARIEPITPPGQVYASQAFAALAASQQVRDFRCEYVRQVQWAKHYGTFPTYLVHRSPER